LIGNPVASWDAKALAAGSDTPTLSTEYDRLNLDRDDPLAALEADFSLGLEGLDEATVRSRLVKIERTLAEWSKGRKLQHLQRGIWPASPSVRWAPP